MPTEFEKKIQEFIEFDSLKKMLELGKIIHTISMAGRDTYEINSDGVTDPAKLRRINEVIQRISSLQLTIASNNNDELDSFIRSSFEMLDHEIESLKIPRGFF